MLTMILYAWDAVRYIARLSDGTIFDKKGYDGEDPFEFKVDEGKKQRNWYYWVQDLEPVLNNIVCLCRGCY